MNKPTPDATQLYADIINMSRPQSHLHKPMSMHDRAAQFAPFAALKTNIEQEHPQPVDEEPTADDYYF